MDDLHVGFGNHTSIADLGPSLSANGGMVAETGKFRPGSQTRVRVVLYSSGPRAKKFAFFMNLIINCHTDSYFQDYITQTETDRHLTVIAQKNLSFHCYNTMI